MALTDPQSITIGGSTISLPRTSVGPGKSEYSSDDGLNVLSVANAYGRRTRRVIRIDTSKLTADPFIPTNNSKVSMSNYMVFDLPVAGYTKVQALEVYTGFVTLLQASSASLVSKVLGGES